MTNRSNKDWAAEAAPTHFLITGGAGFIGSHLADHLLERGHSITAIDNLSTGRIENINHLLSNPNFQFCRDTVENKVVLDRLASEADIIIHLAASVGVERIISNPVETIINNVGGTECVLQAALRYGIRVLVASTSEVYGKGISVPFCEDDDVVLGPTCRNRWGYAASKMVDEFLALAYQHEYDLDVVLMRFFNTVGPRQSGQYGMVIPRLTDQAIDGKELTVYGDGEQSRCFLDVADNVRAVSGLALHPDAPGRVYNIGSCESISIKDLAEKIMEKTDNTAGIKYVTYEEAYAPGFEDMRKRRPCTDRIAELLDWEPKLDLDQTLERVRDQLIEERKA